MARFSYHPLENSGVEIRLDADAIELLIATGWLDEEDQEDPFAVGTAVQDWIDFQATLLQ